MSSILKEVFLLSLQICLTSRDQQNVLVVSYAELHQCLEVSFSELQQAALAPNQLSSGTVSNAEH